MTAKEIAAACGWNLLAGGEGEDNQADGCYVGDLLSWVMARAQSGNVWITVMGNVNAIAVATLTDVCCIVLTENAALDADAAKKAERQRRTRSSPGSEMQGIPVYGCAANSYETAIKVHQLLQ